MSSLIKFKIITPERIVYEDDVAEVTIPTEAGEITVLANHSPLVTLARTGEVRIRKASTDSVQIPLAISSGVVEVRESFPAKNINTEIIILASRSELVTEIDIERAKNAYERAKKLLEEKQHGADVDFARFEALLEKEANRIKVYTKWRK